MFGVSSVMCADEKICRLWSVLVNSPQTSSQKNLIMHVFNKHKGETEKCSVIIHTEH